MEQEGTPHGDDRQRVMFSVTFPANIQRFACDFMRDYIFLTVGCVGAASENVVEMLEGSDQEIPQRKKQMSSFGGERGGGCGGGGGRRGGCGGEFSYFYLTDLHSCDQISHTNVQYAGSGFGSKDYCQQSGGGGGYGG